MSLDVFVKEEDFDLSKCIYNCSLFFDTNVMKNIKITDNIKQIIKIIDDSEYIGGENVLTRYGDTIDLSNISSGCKAVITVLYCPDKIVNMVEAGNNALEYVLHFNKGKVYMPLIPHISENFEAGIDLNINGKKALHRFETFCERCS